MFHVTHKQSYICTKISNRKCARSGSFGSCTQIHIHILPINGIVEREIACARVNNVYHILMHTFDGDCLTDNNLDNFQIFWILSIEDGDDEAA